MIFLICVLVLLLAGQTQLLLGNEDFPDNFPSKVEFITRLNQCRLNEHWCEEHTDMIIDLAISITNDLSRLLMPDVAQSLFTDAYFHVYPNSTLGNKFNHIIGTLAFSQGDMKTAEKYWVSYNQMELVSARSLAAQVIMKGSEEKRGLGLMSHYVDLLSIKFQSLISDAVGSTPRERLSLLNGAYWSGLYGRVSRSLYHFAFRNRNADTKPNIIIQSDNRGSQVSERSDMILLELLLDEAQGSIRKNVMLNDMALHSPSLDIELTSAQRFRLAVGLAKLGHFDLSLRHVWLSATPWEAPLYLLRAKLVFAPVHKSVRSLAIAVDNFETQGEQILVMPAADRQVPLMERVCNSPNDAALALQSLPLLHQAGYSAPRQGYNMGHSPVALSVLLSEIYRSICPVRDVSSTVTPFGLDPVFVESKAAAAAASEGDRKKKKRRKRRSSSMPTNFDGTNEKKEGRDVESDTEIEGPEEEDMGAAPTDTEPSSAGEMTGPVVVKIGIVSGSFDGVPGKIVLGFVESIRRKVIKPLRLELVAMCFPTPRDETTDRVGQVFDTHINLSPMNKTQAISRILDSGPDFVLFTDALLDSRVFALAHERLAPWQGALWGYGGTCGVNAIDFFFIPEPMWYNTQHSGCPMRERKLHKIGELIVSHPREGSGAEERTGADTLSPESRRAAEIARLRQQVTEESIDPFSSISLDGLDGGGDSSVRANTRPHPQSDLFHEQVVYLRGLPPLPRITAMRRVELWEVLRSRYFIPVPTKEPSNHLHALHLYLFPGSVRQMHPEFDQALYVLLKTDPAAMVVMAVPRTGRDRLATVHSAVRHDLMHPAMPAAAAAKLRQRLRVSLGPEISKRVRILPPLEERVYHALRRHVIAVLDPYPVGTHVAILQAMKEGVPVVSAPILQECTHSHAMGIAKALRLSKFSWPSSAEEYAVEAMRLQREEALRLEFVPPDNLRTSYIPRPRKNSSAEVEEDSEANQFDMIEIVGDVPGEPTHGEQLAQFVAGLVQGGVQEMQLEI